MFLHTDTLFWFWDNQSLLFPLNAACVVGKQQIPVLLSLGWPNPSLNPRYITLEASMLIITPLMCFTILSRHWTYLNICLCSFNITLFIGNGSGALYYILVTGNCRHFHDFYILYTSNLYFQIGKAMFVIKKANFKGCYIYIECCFKKHQMKQAEKRGAQ